MKYFEELNDHKAVIIINVTSPSTYRHHADSLLSEISELKDDPNSDQWDSWLDYYVYAVKYHHHGFIFIFNPHILKLQLNIQRKIVAAFHKFLSKSKVIQAFDDVDYALSLTTKKRDNVEWLRKYTEAHMKLDFYISLKTMLRVLSKGFTKKAIKEEHAIQKIRFPEYYIA